MVTMLLLTFAIEIKHVVDSQLLNVVFNLINNITRGAYRAYLPRPGTRHII